MNLMNRRYQPPEEHMEVELTVELMKEFGWKPDDFNHMCDRQGRAGVIVDTLGEDEVVICRVVDADYSVHRMPDLLEAMYYRHRVGKVVVSLLQQAYVAGLKQGVEKATAAAQAVVGRLIGEELAKSK